MEKSAQMMQFSNGKMVPVHGKRPAGPSKLSRTSSAAVETPVPCSYTRHVCMRNRIEGYEFCSRHILEDKSCPFRQCAYTYSKTGRRCLEAVLRSDRRDGYCAEHANKLTMAHKYNGKKKLQPPETPQSLLAEIECHLGVASKLSSAKPVDNLHSHKLASDTSSGSEDELSSQLVNNELTCHDDMDSDAESIDSEQENALKHAGVYTAEEVALIFRDKLIRLQSLYIDQFKRLHHRLREKRREYLRAVRSLPSAASSGETSSSDMGSKTTRNKLSALQRYHRRFGKEALLMRQMKERRRAVYEGDTYQPLKRDVCEHVSDDERCTNLVLPLAKYCLQHIMNDSRQVLYASCGYGEACRQPVASSSARCQLHVQLDPFEYRYNKREQDDNKEETVDVVNVSDLKDDLKQTV